MIFLRIVALICWSTAWGLFCGLLLPEPLATLFGILGGFCIGWFSFSI